MPDMDNVAERLIDLARSQGLIRPCDLALLGIPRVSLTRAVRRGQLERVGRGLYGLPGRDISAHGSLAEVARRVPKGVVCLLSALRFHGLTTPAPFEVWLAIENKAIAPKLDYPPLRIVRFSGAALTEGVEEHIVDGVTVRVTGVAKTRVVLLATGKLVGEGFDHPPLDTLVLAMPISWNGTLQQYAGRLHREHATKTECASSTS